MQRITPDDVLKAIDECRRLGPDKFIEKYGFGEPRSCYLIFEGPRYGAIAIVGVAHGFAQSALDPLTAADPDYRTNHARSTLKRHEFTVTDGKSDHTVAPETADGSSSFEPTIVQDTRKRNLRAMFMREVLKSHYGTEMHEILIPEFPLCIGTLYDKENVSSSGQKAALVPANRTTLTTSLSERTKARRIWSNSRPAWTRYDHSRTSTSARPEEEVSLPR